jgi:hypothetical protein
VALKRQGSTQLDINPRRYHREYEERAQYRKEIRLEGSRIRGIKDFSKFGRKEYAH